MSGQGPVVPEAEVRVSEVKALQTRSGNTRVVLVDDSGNLTTTSRATAPKKRTRRRD